MADDTTVSAPPPQPAANLEHDLFNLNMNPTPPPPPPTTTSTTYSAPNDLLGVDFNAMPLDKPILHRNASEAVLPVPLQATNILQPETKSTSSSNQNINRLDPFKDLFASSTPKTSSNESLASKQAAAAAKLTNTPPTSTTSIPNYGFNQMNKPYVPPTSQPTPPPQQQTSTDLFNRIMKSIISSLFSS